MMSVRKAVNFWQLPWSDTWPQRKKLDGFTRLEQVLAQFREFGKGTHFIRSKLDSILDFKEPTTQMELSHSLALPIGLEATQ